MKNGISTSTATDVPCLARSGINFVFRYYASATAIPTKRLTLIEAKALTTAGIEIGAVYEDAPTKAGYFSNGRGIRDGKSAFQFAVSSPYRVLAVCIIVIISPPERDVSSALSRDGQSLVHILMWHTSTSSLLAMSPAICGDTESATRTTLRIMFAFSNEPDWL
jgi:Domain of unknown function (DUF1906)